jgi:RNA polymerase sigma-70 factor (ECF subfamily)
MDSRDWLAEQFEEHRTHLRAVAFRMLGSLSDADDAVQETWLRLSRSDNSGVENMGGWLTTIVARVSLNMLQSRKARREEPVGSSLPEDIGTGRNGHGADGTGPEHEAVLADSVGLALLVVLDTLTPAERLAFVLHDMFAVPFEEIAPVVDRTPAATRKLASRARRRVQGTPTAPDTDLARRREIVGAFLAASRGGDLGALVAVLDPDVVVRADQTAARMGAEAEVRGVDAVAGFFSGRAQTAQLVLVNGVAGAVWAPGGRPRVVFGFTITGGKITAIDLLADRGLLRDLDLVMLEP